MKYIYSAYSHLELKNKKDETKPKWQRSSSNKLICESKPMRINSYKELVRKVAEIAYYNRDYHLFFRGQSEEHMDHNMSTILPSIYRKKKEAKKLELKKHFEILNETMEKFHKALLKEPKKWIGTSIMTKYKEIKWSILQHYEIFKEGGGTPLLDITQSLHVACSFALSKWNKNKYGIIYVLGMPAVTESISYFVNQELYIVRLLNFCSPSAERPFFQEGYTVGPFPIYKLDDSSRKDQFDFHRRLVAKFKIPNNPTSFFGDGFKIIPYDLLFPPNDKFQKFLKKI